MLSVPSVSGFTRCAGVKPELKLEVLELALNLEVVTLEQQLATNTPSWPSQEQPLLQRLTLQLNHDHQLRHVRQVRHHGA